MFYFKVKRDSKLFEKLTKANEMQKKWFANRKDIYKTVGLPVVETIFMAPGILYYPEKPPKELQDQFRKRLDPETGCYLAKVNSPLNKKWSSLCDQRGLAFVPSLNIMIREALFDTPYIFGSGLKTFAQIGNDYYLEGEKQLPEADFLEQVTEREYLEARLKVTA